MGIADLLRNYIQKRINEEVNKEIEAIAEIVERKEGWEYGFISFNGPVKQENLKTIAAVIRKRKR